MKANNELMNLNVLSYSANQKCFHIEKLGEFLVENGAQILNGTDAGYRLIAISSSSERLDHTAEMFRGCLNLDESAKW